VAIERTFDEELIRKIVTHDSIWEWVSDDGADKQNYKPPMHESCYWLLVKEGDEVLGAYFLHQHNFITYEIHTCLLPAAWGRKAKKAAKDVLFWMFSNTICMKVITNIPENNEKAMFYALRAGLQQEGLNRSSFLKNGKLLDQRVLGITKEEFLCQQQQ
jgi:RimJ/RimL family protein N-acetyltransferase